MIYFGAAGEGDRERVLGRAASQRVRHAHGGKKGKRKGQKGKGPSAGTQEWKLEPQECGCADLE